MTGRPYVVRLIFGLRAPKHPVPGRDLAGTVAAIGSAVTGFAPGDEVFGIGNGAFAQYAVAPAAKLAHRPAGLTLIQAAVLPVSGLTALQALRKGGAIKPGARVLVIGASGGVGSYAVQLAVAAGAEVTGVCSVAGLELVRSLGATHVIDYGSEDFAAGERRYDLVLDIAGNPSLARLRRVLTPTGTAVMVGGEHGGNLTGGMGRQLRARLLSPFLRRRLTGVLCSENAADLTELAELVVAGSVTPSVGCTYQLDEVPEALRQLETGTRRGKVAIVL